MYCRFRGSFSRPTNRPTIAQTLPAFCPPVAHPRAGHQDAEIRAMLDQTDLPDLAAAKARRQTDTPLPALHAAWVAAMACHNSIFDDCDGRPGSDRNLADATFALVMRLEAEIAAFVPTSMQDLAIKLVVADFEARDASQAALVRMVHAIAGIEIAPSLAAALADLGPPVT